MSTDDLTTGLIELGDMSKLRVLMRLRSRGEFEYAKDIASEIEGADAKAAADQLLRRFHAAEANGSATGPDAAASMSNGHPGSTNGTQPSATVLAIVEKIEKSWAEHNMKVLDSL